MNTPTETSPPAGSRIASRLEGADFHDAWAIDAADPSLSALRQFLKAVQATPRWVNTCMTLRNRVVQVFGCYVAGEKFNQLPPAMQRKRAIEFMQQRDVLLVWDNYESALPQFAMRHVDCGSPL